MDTFTPPLNPTIGMKNKPEVKLWKADFGDGYTQPSPAGLNNIRKIYELSWDVLTPAQAQQILNFLQTQAGFQTFLYTIPGDTTATKFTCEQWSESYDSAGYRGITATFRQSFNIL